MGSIKQIASDKTNCSYDEIMKSFPYGMAVIFEHYQITSQFLMLF